MLAFDAYSRLCCVKVIYVPRVRAPTGSRNRKKAPFYLKNMVGGSVL